MIRAEEFDMDDLVPNCAEALRQEVTEAINHALRMQAWAFSCWLLSAHDRYKNQHNHFWVEYHRFCEMHGVQPSAWITPAASSTEATATTSTCSGAPSSA